MSLIVCPTTSSGTHAQTCKLFKELARKTWSDLREAHNLHFALSEESITDFLLLELLKTIPASVSITKFSKSTEGKTTGADWEWWFLGAGRGFGLRIQAKKLSTKKLKYEELARNAGRSGKSQVNLLLRDARKANLYPIYCFYNYWKRGTRSSAWLGKSFSLDPRLLGCAVADALRVKSLITKGRNDIQSVGKYCLPWSHLVCCKGSAKNPRTSLPYRVRDLANQLRGATDPRVGSNQTSVPEVIGTGLLPDYVKRILDRPETETINCPEGRAVDGVVVLREID